MNKQVQYNNFKKISELTKEYQRQVQYCMEEYFRRKLIKSDDNNMYNICIEYDKQLESIKKRYAKKAKYFLDYTHDKVLLSAIAEPCTYYTQGDYKSSNDSNSIYSPRIDIAFSPIIKKKIGKNESIGVYNLTKDVKLYRQIHQLPFVRELEEKIRIKSNENMKDNQLEECNLGIEDYNEYQYDNTRPLHLFGIEIENQKNAKHLMGDFINAINLSLIPVVVIPEDRISNLMNMLKYNKTIENIKGLKTYNLLKKVSVLTVSQFRDVLNELLGEENIKLINVHEYN